MYVEIVAKMPYVLVRICINTEYFLGRTLKCRQHATIS